jgi:caspase domain-containing protein
MGKLFALLAGINDYRAPLKPLGGCRDDVRRAEALLHARVAADDLRVHKLLDGQATRTALLDGFRRHLDQAGPGDTALFWFSGHGSIAPLPDGWPYAEAAGVCQTLVCADSRRGGVPDLYDKELSLLSREVADRGAHLVTVLDCCHAESGMRGVDDDGLTARLAPPDPAPPGLDALLPLLNAGDLAPGAHDPRQVTLAACQTFEKAYELNGGGAFTRALVRTVAHLPSDATYREVMAVTRARVEGHLRRQNPVLEPREPGGAADQPFLGGLLGARAAQVTMVRASGGWTIDAGSLHGLATPAHGEVTRFAVHGRAPLAEVQVGEVYTDRSAVEPIDWQPDPGRAYPMVLTRIPLPAVAVAIDGDPGLAARLAAAIAAAGPGGRPSPHVEVVTDAQLATDRPGLRVLAPPGGPLTITSPDGARLAGPLPADVPGLRRTVDRLEHIARWLHVRNLDNPGSALPGAVRLDLLPARPGETLLSDDDRPDLGPGPVKLDYRRTATGWEPPSIFLRLTNTGNRRLYCAVLDLTDTHRIHAGLFPGEHLAAGWSAAAAHGRPIRLSLPPGRPVRPGARVTDWFLLLVAETPFAAETLVLPRLDEPEEQGRRTAAALHSVPGLLGLAASRRDAEAGPVTAADWTSAVVEVETTVPA